jgi:hypothetical protein
MKVMTLHKKPGSLNSSYSELEINELNELLDMNVMLMVCPVNVYRTS